MDIVRKLFFAPFFLFSLVVFLIFTDQLLIDPLGVLLGFNAAQAFSLIYLVAALVISSMFYIIFSSLANDWKIVLPVVILGSLVPIGLIPTINLAIYLSIGIFIALIVGFLVQQQKMQSYITFSAVSLMNPQIKLVQLLLISGLSVAFYFSTAAIIEEKGFSIPDPLIEAAVNLSGSQDPMNSLNTETSSPPSVPQLSPELVSQLKQNPALLAQYGVTPAQLDMLAAPSKKTTTSKTSGSPTLVSTLVKSQVDKIVEPYKGWIAPLMAVLFFVSLTSLSSFFSLFLTPIIGLIFMILEKTNFIHFEKEMREVKKLVV